MNKLTEPFWLAWLNWHLYRHRRGQRYADMWEMRKFVRALPNGGIMVDCGANVGDVSKLFLDKDYTVHAFEPDPAALEVLRKRYGHFPKMHIHPKAVSTENTKLVLHRVAGVDAEKVGSTISSSLYTRPIHADDNAVEVEVVDLFAFIDSLPAPVDFLKLDVEGAEVPILEKMLNERHDKKLGHVLVETHERFSPDFAERLAAIRERVREFGIRNLNLDWH